MADSSSEAVPAETGEDVNAPDASTGEPDVKQGSEASTETEGVEKSLIGAVTAALGKEKAESPAATDGKEKADPPETTEGKADEPDDLTEDEVKKLAPRTQSRIRYLNDQVKTLGAEVEKHKAGAQLSDQILDYMESHGIAAEEFQNMLTLTALTKTGKYEQALEVLKPVYQELLNRTGDVLPDDLKQQVRLGKITEENARELHRARTKAKNADERTKIEADRTAQAKAKEEWQARQTMASQTASEWDKAQAASDPDWHMKQPLVINEIELLLRRGGRDKYPKTAAEVREIADAAKKSVEARLKGLAPKPAPREMPQGDPASPRSFTPPKNLMDAVNQGLAKAAAGSA